MAGIRRIDFNNRNVIRNILGTALPMLVAQVFALLYNIVDRIYIARIPEIGTEALGAVGLCFPVIILVTAFTNMYGMGGAPLFSIEFGRKNREKAAAILNTCFRLELVTAAVLTVVVLLFTPGLLIIFGSDTASLQYAVPYLRLYILGTAFSMISTGMNPFINAQGYSFTGMMTVMIGAVSNIILDPLFIFVFGLGVQGAAIATVISQGLSFAFSLRFFIGKKNEFRLKRGTDFPYARQIAALGTAPFIMQVTNSLVSIACNTVLMRFGGAVYVSVMTIINSIRQVVDTPVMAVTEGASPTLSFNYGARRPELVKKGILFMTVIAVSYTLIIWLMIERVPELFIGLFSEDTRLMELAREPIHLYFLAFIFQSLQYSGQTVFKSLGKKKMAIFFSLLRKAVMVIPLTFLLPYAFHMGSSGVFAAEPISNLIGGLSCFLTMLITVLPELKRMKQADIKHADTKKAANPSEVIKS
jgi:putative MATE family efflux protein